MMKTLQSEGVKKKKKSSSQNEHFSADDPDDIYITKAAVRLDGVSQ